MAPAVLLQHNVQPLRSRKGNDEGSEQDGESIFSDEGADSDAPSSDVQSGPGSEDESQSSEDEQQDGDSDAEDFGGEPLEAQISSVSFGALKQAQDSLSKKRKREQEPAADQEQKLQALRERLQQIKKSKSADSEATSRKSSSRVKSTEGGDRSNGTRTMEDDSSDSDSDSAPSEEGAVGHSRSSKHAPASQSTKYQVSRKRTVIEVPKVQFRDPRFDAIQQSRHGHDGDSEKAYKFLREYEKDEIAELRAAIKKTRNEDDKEKLWRTVGSMENRIKSKEAKERNQEVIRQHRREERAKVEQGKTPYYLKDKEIKERALVERFKGMKSKEREKVIEKRQLRESQKEKKRMPRARRMVG